ncbi:rhamnogalacturonan lyase [Micrococcales bacterium 31B]|nr:rhamnogalacturonan lyase [Micrococcales bacterium 31B]
MTRRPHPVHPRSLRAALGAAATVTLFAATLSAVPAPAHATTAASALNPPNSAYALNPVNAANPAAPQLEALDRGLVAARSGDGVYLSWRLLAEETFGAGDTGMLGVDFAVYRDGRRIATVTDSTNYLDATPGARYQVAPVRYGIEGARSAVATPQADNFVSIPLQKPAPGVTPAGEAYDYSANDLSVGDLDGDGDYEYLVKWYPSNAKDNSQKGYTGNTYIDAYQTDGTLLYRIDLGVNIRSGAHYTQFMVYDFDGDGRSEIMLKTAPGTQTIAAGVTTGITLPAADIAAGVTAADDYRWSSADYYEHLVTVFAGWSERPEVASGQWPATVEQALGVPVTHGYPLSDSSARELVDYFMDVYAPSRSANNTLRDFEGFVQEGPEYLTVFDGATGSELATQPFAPARGDDGLLWGDYAMPRIEPGNRNDRFLSGVAYLDGQHASAVFARGYYTRSTIGTYDWDGTHLTQRWFVDSGHVPLSNPFNDSPHGRDGTDPEFATLTTQGFHSLSAADVDGDGKQEVVYGSATIDDDGSLLYSSFDTLPEGSADPGASARLGHGDAMHVTDIVPGNPGLEIFTVHEGAANAPYGWALRDAASGEVLAGTYSGRDTGRGMVGDIDPALPGLEYWASMPPGSGTPAEGAGTNQSIHWAADMTTQLVSGSGDQDVSLLDGDNTVVFTAPGTRSNNGTKGNAGLVADVFGDWREELLVRTADSSAIRVYFSTEVTDRKLTTLMHDPQYRAEVARQNTAYNQPSYTEYRLASDIDYADVPVFTRLTVPTAPRVVDRPGKGRDGFEIADAPGVTYYANGTLLSPGFHRNIGAVTVTAVPEVGYRFAADATATWRVTATAP